MTILLFRRIINKMKLRWTYTSRTQPHGYCIHIGWFLFRILVVEQKLLPFNIFLNITNIARYGQLWFWSWSTAYFGHNSFHILTRKATRFSSKYSAKTFKARVNELLTCPQLQSCYFGVIQYLATFCILEDSNTLMYLLYSLFQFQNTWNHWCK